MKRLITTIAIALCAAIVRATAGYETGTMPAPVAPPLLSQTGLYAGEGTLQIDARNRPFSPQYPLWSDGAEKSRWVRLPEDSRIDVSDVDAWQFPVGAKFWKQFTWGGRKVETRMIWKAGEEDWVFATYQWTEDQADALLAPEAGVSNVVEITRGKRHSIPGIEDCNSCHRSSPAVVLGFNALQLSDDRDPVDVAYPLHLPRIGRVGGQQYGNREGEQATGEVAGTTVDAALQALDAAIAPPAKPAETPAPKMGIPGPIARSAVS
jgi:hypothetical protein